ncbi:MAG TPA: molecular chaperone DnaJ [Caulobacteraceae bacterium]
MVFVALGAGLLAVLIWAGRSAVQRGAQLRIACALFAAMAAAGAVVAGLRGQWLGVAVLVGLSAYCAHAARRGRQGPVKRTSEPMSLFQAREILGVTSTAANADVEAAYRRLIQLAHPDRGGSNGLAAQLNAARDRLLKPGR